MSYELIYTVPFASINNEACIVDIEKEGYSGKVTELTASTSPFTVDIEDEDFLYGPARFSTATIRIVGNDYLQSLFSTAYQQYRVTFKKNGVIMWCGFVKPELYTQDYSSEVFEFELECVSAMSTLEYLDYKQQSENSEFVSLWDLLKKCTLSANAKYTAVYIPHVYGVNEIEYNSDDNVLERMTISEQNFFDEDGKPMKMREVLEEICKFMNWTCVDWRGELYFVDIDHSGEFRKYDPLSFNWDGDTITPESINIKFIDFAGSDHSLDILPGYNKVTIKCSNYPVVEMFSQDENYNELKVVQEPEDLREGNRVCHRQFLKPNNIETVTYILNSEGRFTKLEDIETYKGDVNSLHGAIPMRYCNYELVDGKPNIGDYSYTDVIRVRNSSEPGYDVPFLDDILPCVKIKGPCAMYADGAITINGLIKPLLSAELSPLKTEYKYYSHGLYFALRIGENSYNAEEESWGRGAFLKVILWRESGEEWLKIKNGKTLNMPYPGASGLIIPINKPMYGSFECTIHCFRAGWDQTGQLLKDIKLEYVKANTDGNGAKENSDRIYENVINDTYINELDEIEFKISSYNNDGACFSKVLLNGIYLTNNLYSDIEGTMIRPEEQLIRRIIKRYSIPRIKLTQVVKETSDLTPISCLSDNYMVNKRFINTGGTIDYAMNQFECIMQEI